MKLIKKIRLAFREGKSDKIYEVDLVELPRTDAARFLVNFRYGRRGTSLREGTKTANPVTQAEAEETYRSVVVSKTNGGYYDESGPAPAKAAAPAVQVSPAAHRSRQEARRAALLNALAEESSSKKRARIIWNLGHDSPSEASASAVVACVNRGDWIEDFSIAWTLGRWRDGAHVAVLEKLQRHSNKTVGEIASESLLLALPPSAAANLLQVEKGELPPMLLAAIDGGNPDDIERALQAGECAGVLNRALAICYRLALIAPAVQRALLKFLTHCPFAPGTFKGVRHVFKTAELRLDDDMFALLAHRFEVTAPFFRHQWDRVYIPGQGSLVVSKELARDTPRLAYSNRTRAYMRKRAWRTLLRLGRADSERYVSMAKALLLQVSDSDAVEPRQRQVHRWDEEGRRRRAGATLEYGPYAHLLVFNHILHGADRSFQLSASGAAWFRSGKTKPPERGDMYPHLWDQAPSAPLDLLKSSRCSLVHDAAIAMLAGQTQFLAALSPGDVAQLVASSYPQTAQFGLTLAQALFQRGAGDDHLLLALLQSPLQQAREFGVQVLSAHSSWLNDVSFLIELLLVFSPPIPDLIDTALGTVALSDSDQQQLLVGVITQLFARNIVMSGEAAQALARTLVSRVPAAVSSLPLTLIDRLLSHPDLGKQLLGARLLVANQVSFKDIPDRLLQHIHGSAHEEIRAIAVALLSKQAPEDLLQQADMLAELWYRGAAIERRELLDVLETLAVTNAAYEAKVLRALSAMLFRSEHDVGQGDELYAFFDRHRAGAADAFDKDMVWRLLQAQAVAAQRVGAVLLHARSATEFSVRQWARLTHHSDLSARTFAMNAFASHEELVKQHTPDALRLLDTPWEEAREFGFKFFRERYGEADWSPEFIVGICDSTQADVQAFGRELLQRFFQQAQGPQYLTTLSEHPSVNVQLFVSNFLEQHAAGHSERILGLRGYFITVLSQINKARVCKDRILQFLLREALRDASVAAMTAEIFGELSLTVVRKDRSQLIKALIALRSAFPQLPVPIKVIAPRSRTAPPSRAGTSSGI